MLIEFRTANHRSIREEQVLSMAAAPKIGAKDDPRPRDVGYAKKLLPVAALYGANASGKTNVLSALAFMKDAVSDSTQMWKPGEGVPHDPFKWGPTADEPSFYEAEFLCNGVRYQYGFATDNEKIVEEWLYAWPKGHRQKWFTRTDSDITIGHNLLVDAKIINDLTRPNALVLSTAVQLKQDQLATVYTWFEQMQFMGINSRPLYLRRFRAVSHQMKLHEMLSANQRGQQKYLKEHEKTFINWLGHFILNADVGVVDIKSNSIRDNTKEFFKPRIELKHDKELEDSWLPLEDESRGTRSLLNMAMPIFEVITEGSVLVVDELESSLHPKIAEAIIRLFNDPATNPNHAQLIFTTHDTNLLGTTMGEPVLRRDEVWLTEKNPEGATVLYSLTDFQPRKEENLERGYLQGRFGAVPFLGSFALHVKNEQ